MLEEALMTGETAREPGSRMPEVSAHVDLPAIEREMLARWSLDRTFDRSLRQTAAGPRWTFYE
jgi:isoleucyl-tRNA synthetase